MRIRPAGMGGGGAEQPGIDGPADGLAEVAGHLAGEGRDRVGQVTALIPCPRPAVHC